MHTSHIAAYYYHMWRKSGGHHEWKGINANLWTPVGGNIEYFNKYWIECDNSYKSYVH